jgi:cell division protein FtsA
MYNGSKLIIGLDIGTTKICTVVAEEEREGDAVRILGVGHALSRGLRKGVVVDMDRAIESIVKSVEDAEKMANVEIHSVFTGIAGGHVKSFNSRGIAAIEDGSEISARDVERAITAARAVSLPADREILHTIPQEFIVDGQGGVKDPKGLSGVRLEADVHIITGAISPAQNIVKSINRAGFEVDDIVLESLASGISVLSEDEKKSGVILVDMGGGTTDYVIFQDDVIKLSDVLAVGGDHITNDISVALRLPISRAEEVKIKYGCALAGRVDPSEEFECQSVSAGIPQRYSRRNLAHVVELRMEEMLSLVKLQMKRSGVGQLLGAGVVLTGGASLMEGSVELAQRVFGLPVRVGRPTGITGLKEMLDNPMYATGAGLTQYGHRYRKEGRQSRFLGRSVLRKFFDHLRGWFSRG